MDILQLILGEYFFLARELEVLKSIYFFRVDVSDQHSPSSEHPSSLKMSRGGR